ncbi:MAG TPA: transposase [Candidatus Saccharimonadales bacterium]
MPKLPEIDADAIGSLDEAKQVIKQILNSFALVLKELDAIKKENTLLKEEVARLKKQPKKPQFGSSQQSSTTPTQLLKEKGKHWHKSARTTIEIDQDIQLPEIEMCLCGATDFRTIKTTKKVVQGLVIKRNNTAYHGKKKACTACGEIYVTEVPKDVKGLSFDSEIQSLTSFLKFACRFTHPLLHRFLTGFGVQISYGQVTEILQRNSQKLHLAYTHLRTTGLYKSTYLQSDATGAKRKQKSSQQIEQQFLHIVGNQQLSLFKITKKYNSKITTMLLGKHGRKKIYLSDDASPNGNKLQIIRKQLCWIHEIRHYLKFTPRFKLQREQLKTVTAQWREFYHEAKAYGQQPTQAKKDTIRNLFDKITTQVTGYEQLDTQLALTKKKRKKLLLFLTYPIVPIQNNQAERDVRDFVIMRKISGETKSLKGDRSIERHLSIIQTARKQGLNVYETLHGLLTETLSLSVLTANIS